MFEAVLFAVFECFLSQIFPGHCSSRTAILFLDFSINGSDTVMIIDLTVHSVSACESISAAHKSRIGRGVGQHFTSEGPAGMSMATLRSDTSCLAAVTYSFPGPKILYTFGTVCVPYAIAAIACVPPILKMRWRLLLLLHKALAMYFACLFPEGYKAQFSYIRPTRSWNAKHQHRLK